MHMIARQINQKLEFRLHFRFVVVSYTSSLGLKDAVRLCKFTDRQNNKFTRAWTE
jgi:hypothetical protein